jgi:archaellum component FlaF (FlaF/FlaG flagellin family)
MHGLSGVKRGHVVMVVLTCCALLTGMLPAASAPSLVSAPAGASPTVEHSLLEPQAHRGSLRVRLTAVPRTRPVVTVTGPRGYRRVLRTSKRLTRLRPGVYRVRAAKVTRPNGRVTVRVTPVRVRVRAGRRAQVRVTYRFTATLPAAPAIIRVSVSSNGTPGNGSSASTPAVSGDGRYVAFQSQASNLVPGDTNNVRDVFVHDRETRRTSRVSIASNGAQGNGYSYGGRSSISADGRYVTFTSAASNLVAGDTNQSEDVFLHDRSTGATARVSVSGGGAQSNGDSYWAVISSNGRYIAFASTASNLVPGDTNGQEDVFVYDRVTGSTTRVSVASDGTQADGELYGQPEVSGDGRYVAFTSFAANLAPKDTTRWRSDVFVHDRSTGTTSRVSIATDGSQANDDSAISSISEDGRYLTFQSFATNLAVGNFNGHDEFLHDRLTGETTRLARTPSGAAANGAVWGSVLSADGRYVAFQAERVTNLTPGRSSGVFVQDRQTGSTKAWDGQFPALSADARYVAFTSRSITVMGGDGNDPRENVFLARVR